MRNLSDWSLSGSLQVALLREHMRHRDDQLQSLRSELARLEATRDRCVLYIAAVPLDPAPPLRLLRRQRQSTAEKIHYISANVAVMPLHPQL